MIDHFGADFNFVHQAHRGFASESIAFANPEIWRGLDSIRKIGQMLIEGKERLTRRGEYAEFRAHFDLSMVEARKYLNFAKTFGDWAIEKLVTLSRFTNIFTLCKQNYAPLVLELASLDTMRQDQVLQIIKEFKQKQKEEKARSIEKEDGKSADADADKEETGRDSKDVLRQRVDRKDGTIYYTLKEINLSEYIGALLREQLKERSFGQILASIGEQRGNQDRDLERVEELEQTLKHTYKKMQADHDALVEILHERDTEILALKDLLQRQERNKAATHSPPEPPKESASESQPETKHDIHRETTCSFLKGDRVRHSDPYVVMHVYQGTIEQIFDNEVLVRWDQWSGRVRECDRYLMTELTLIS